MKKLLSSYSEEFEQEDWFVVEDAYELHLHYRAKRLEDCIMDVYVELEPYILSEKATKAVSACHKELEAYARTVLPLFGWSPALSEKTAGRISDDEWKNFLIEEFHTRKKNTRLMIEYRNRLFSNEH